MCVCVFVCARACSYCNTFQNNRFSQHGILLQRYFSQFQELTSRLLQISCNQLSCYKTDFIFKNSSLPMIAHEYETIWMNHCLYICQFLPIALCFQGIPSGQTSFSRQISYVDWLSLTQINYLPTLVTHHASVKMH